MIRVIPGAEHGGRGFRLVEPDGTVTTLTVWQERDLAIQQKKPGQEPTGFSTYSDPGTVPYASILRFLALNKVKLPPEPVPAKKQERFANAKWGSDFATPNDFFAHLPFPLRFRGVTPDLRVIAHWVNHGKFPLLEFNYENHPTAVRLSLPLAQKLAVLIPKIYAGVDVSTFQEIHREMKKMVADKSLFRERDVKELRPFQHEFKFKGKLRPRTKKGTVRVRSVRRIQRKTR